MDIQLAYSTTLLAAAATLSAPLNAALAAAWLQFSYAPPTVGALVYPVVYERQWVRGFIDVDQVGTLNVLISDDAATTRATITLPIPINVAGDGTTIAIRLPGGKFVRMTYVNGAVVQARFALLLNLTRT